MAIQLQFRRGTAEQWAAANTILAEGEVGFEIGTKKFKFGDGVTAWNDLAYEQTAGPAYVPVSGTDLKTINGQSIVGPGNIVISAPAYNPVSGTDLKTINGQSIVGPGNLIISAPAYSPVSGTDLKTINGSSIVGPGNLNVVFAPVSGTDLKTINGSSIVGPGNLVIAAPAYVPVSGTDLKTINGYSIVGPGNLTVAGGSSLTRYEAGAGTGCYVLATGSGVTITKVNNTAVIAAPAGVQVISAAIHFLTTEIGANTNCVIDFGTDQGTGDNSDYTKAFVPQFQVWADVAGNRSFKAGAAGTFNVNSHTITITGLTSSQAIWINMSF